MKRFNPMRTEEGFNLLFSLILNPSRNAPRLKSRWLNALMVPFPRMTIIDAPLVRMARCPGGSDDKGCPGTDGRDAKAGR